MLVKILFVKGYNLPSSFNILAWIYKLKKDFLIKNISSICGSEMVYSWFPSIFNQKAFIH